MADLSSFFDTVSLLNQVPELGNCLNDNDIPVSGNVHEQINKLSQKSSKDCDQLLNFLLEKLESMQPAKTKLKALKLIQFLVVNGNQRFRINLRKNDWLIKDATGASEVVDPIYGNSVSQALRTTSKEVLQDLYENFDDDHNGIETSPRMHTCKSLPSSTYTSGTGHLGGMGSNRITGKMEGFGNTPKNISTNQTTMSKMMDGLSDVLDKFLYPPISSVAAQSFTVTDVGGYEAVTVPPRDPVGLSDSLTTSSPTALIKPATIKMAQNASNRRAHVPGRAGGGWEDEYDHVIDRLKAASESGRCSSQSAISEDSLDKLVAGDPMLLESEQLLVDDITNKIDGSCELNPFRSVLKLDNLCQRCCTLNIDKMIELLHQRLVNGQEDVVKMRILMLIEAFVHRDVIHVDSLLATFENSLRQLQNTDSNDLKVKSTKILLILQRLRQETHDGSTSTQLG